MATFSSKGLFSKWWFWLAVGAVVVSFLPASMNPINLVKSLLGLNTTNNNNTPSTL